MAKIPNASAMKTIERPQRWLCRNSTPSQMIQACSSLLIPLTIAIFTITTTMLQMNLAKQEREQDLLIANDNREKDLQIANQMQVMQNEIEENRRIAEGKAQENQQMNAVLATYLKDVSELLLSRNFTLTDKLITTVIRAKTLTTLGQLDGKRKSHIVRFLYEAQMINVAQPSINLADADLSSVDLTDYKLINASFVKCNLFNATFRKTILQGVDFRNVNLNLASFDNSYLKNVTFSYAQLNSSSFDNSHLTDVTFSYAQLNSSSFDNSYLKNVTFYEANLTDASFVRGHLTQMDFSRAIVTNANFTGIRALGAISMKGINTIFNEADLTEADFAECILINASFIKAQLVIVDMSNAILDGANFTNADLFGTNFYRSKLSESIFDRSNASFASFDGTDLVATKWLDSDVRSADFSQANLSLASITDDQIRRAWKMFNTILPDGSLGNDTNLLQNGHAEGVNDECGTSPWHIKSVVAEKHSDKFPRNFGQCYFIAQSNTTQATMSQRIQVPIEYGEWIRTGAAFIWVTGICVSSFASYIFIVTLTNFIE
jgi:uncharacterized protein YjbI with pentapeptide repeats